jgi:transcriptional regulator with XRE-family HTH domain
MRSNSNPSIKAVARLAAALGVEPACLLAPDSDIGPNDT